MGFVAAAGAIVLAVAGFGAALVAAAVPAFAQAVPPLPPPPQVLPPVPAPQPPAQAKPVFAFLAPTLYPNCGAAALIAFLPGSEVPALPGPYPYPVPGPYIESQVYDVTGPLFVMCAAVPRPTTEYKCLLDAQQEAILNTLEANAAGTTVPLGLHPEGSLVEQSIVVEDKLPASAKPVDVGSLAVQFLVCSPIVDEAPPPGQFFPPIAEPSNEPFTPGTSSYLPGTVGTTSRTIGGYGAITGSLPATNRPSTPVGEGVRYAAVWLLPLGLLGLFGYVGPALTRELPLPKP
jgi:hypothetical protein